MARPSLLPVVELQAARAEQQGWTVLQRRDDGVRATSPDGITVDLDARLLWRALERLGPDAPPEALEGSADAQRASTLGLHPWPAWQDARGMVLFSPERPPRSHGDALLLELGEDVCAAVMLTDGGELAQRWVGAEAMAAWGVDDEAVLEAAALNTAALLEETELQVNRLKDVPCGVMLTASVFKASLVMAPNLRSRVEPVLGWPLVAVMPNRDFLLLVPDAARELLPRLGAVVAAQFRDHVDPLTPEVFLLSDEGIQVAGRFEA